MLLRELVAKFDKTTENFAVFKHQPADEDDLIDSKVVKEKLQIQHRVGDVEVANKPTPYKWAWLDETGKEWPEAQVKHFQLLPDGKEQEVQPFPRTEVLETLKLMDTVVLDEFLKESEYELWAKNESEIPALWKLANYLRKNDKVLVSKHSFGRGFNQNYALIYPVFREDSFVLVMVLTKTRKQFSHLMPMTSMEPKAEKKLAVPVLLPEI